MRKIKKVLGLVLAVTICVLGLASCGESNSTVEIETQSKDKGVLTIENVKGELYAQTYNFETTKGVGANYLFLGEDGRTYTTTYSKADDTYTFNGSSKWELLDSSTIKIGSHIYIKSEKYLTTVLNGQITAMYRKVDGLVYANK